MSELLDHRGKRLRCGSFERWARRHAVLLTCVSLAAMLVFLALTVFLAVRKSYTAFYLAMGAAAVFLPPFAVASFARAMERERLQRAIRYRCPGCNHSLEGLPIESDGCAECPECGAAWRLDPKPDA